MDSLPNPNFDDYFEQSKEFFQQQGQHEIRQVTYETSRGCWFGKCRFCGMGNTKFVSYRKKSPNKIICEINEFEKKYRISTVLMEDLAIPLPYFETLLPQIEKSQLKSNIMYEVRTNLSLKQMLLLKKARVSDVFAGIEAISPVLLKMMNKGVTLSQNIAFLRYAKIVGIRVVWMLMYAFPGDKIEAYTQTHDIMRLLHHLQPPIRLSPLNISRFSDYWHQPSRFGLKKLRAWPTYKDILPSNVDPEEIAYSYDSDFSSEVKDNPELFLSLVEEIANWNEIWVKNKSSKSRERFEGSLPVLEIKKINYREYLLRDTRRIGGQVESILTKEQAKISLIGRNISKEDNNDMLIKWAVDQKLGISIGSQYIPLATADLELLMEFEVEDMAFNSWFGSI